MESGFETTIQTNKRTGTILFNIIFLIAVVAIISKPGTLQFIKIIFFGAGLVIFFNLLKMLFGSVKIILTPDTLKLEYQLFDIRYWQSSYDTGKIDNIQPKVNENASTYWSLGKFRSVPFLYTPEFLKVYDTNPSTIHFHYEGVKKKIGEGLEEFNTALIEKELKKRIKKQ